MGPIDFDFRPLFILIMLVGILVGSGCSLFATSGCCPTIRVEWREPNG